MTMFIYKKYFSKQTCIILYCNSLRANREFTYAFRVWELYVLMIEQEDVDINLGLCLVK